MKKITFEQFFFKLDAPKTRDLFRGNNKMTNLIMFPCFPTRKGLTCPKEQVTQYSSFFRGAWVGEGGVRGEGRRY